MPYVEAVVLLSNRQLDCRLTGPAGIRVFTRNGGRNADRDLIRYLAADADTLPHQRLDAPQVRATLRALDEIGLRKIQREFTVADWSLTQLLHETDVYQDWVGTHVRAEQSKSRIRLDPWPASGPETGKKARRRAADREFELLDRADHPGILSLTAVSVQNSVSTTGTTKRNRRRQSVPKTSVSAPRVTSVSAR